MPDRSAGFPDSVVVGWIRRPHGLAGEISVESLSDVPDRLAVGSEVMLVSPGGERRPARIQTARSHRGAQLLRLDCCRGREEAEEIRGWTLEVERSAVPRPEEGSYYLFELLGCACSDKTAGELGEVVDVSDDGGGYLLVVERDGRRLLVPFVSSFLSSIDVDAGRIELDLPAGLIETCTSTS